MSALVELTGISKSYGGVHALSNVSFEVKTGEVHALLGENGAGKSTLMKILGGSTQPNSGSIRIDGRDYSFRDPGQAQAQGIAVIHQELALAQDLSVAENIFLGKLPGFISFGDLNRRAADLISRMGFDIDPTTIVSSLTVAHQQVVEIAKALSNEARVMVFDEPTSVLPTRDAERLHQIIGELRDQGVGIVYISHRLEEVFNVSDRMTVLKDGRYVGTTTPAASSIDDVIRMMVGRPIETMFPPRGHKVSADDLLTVRNLSRGRRVRNVSFGIKGGEVVGLGGLVGSGRTEVARLIFGADRADQGEIAVRGIPVRMRSPRDAVRHGIGLVPEDRKAQGVAINESIRVNTTMARMSEVVGPFGFIKGKHEIETVTRLGKTLKLKSAGIHAPVNSLSGGNQQKVVLAKWFHVDGDVILLDEPTRGVDVGAKAEIYALISQLAEAGKAVLVISSEHQELFGLCDRVLVMREGEVRGELKPEDYREEALLTLAMTKAELNKHGGDDQ
ncbi:MAG: sugar ABC transporter ATP-binding protein [bacterium]